MRSIASIRGICSLGSGRRPPLFSSTRGLAQRPTYRTTAAMAEAAIDRPRMYGGIADAPAGTENDPKFIELARFAVAEHNIKANAAVEFERVVKVRGQLVSGTMHYLTIEAKEGGAKKLYEAQVWVKVWENFKKLQEFKPAT